MLSKHLQAQEDIGDPRPEQCNFFLKMHLHHLRIHFYRDKRHKHGVCPHIAVDHITASI